MTIRYPTLSACREILFPIIREHMAAVEPAPFYENEQRGLDKLESTFELMQRDNYPDALDKAAYLFCSVIDGHPFSNGNKRLAVTLLIYMLLVNDYKIHAPTMDVVHAELLRLFPKLRWEKVNAFHHAHEFFFYHLALVIADRGQKGQMTFGQERQAVKELLLSIAVR